LVQVSAPSSISAWFSAPGRGPFTMRSASDQSWASVSRCPRGVSMPNNRANTRATLPSTKGSSRSNAIEPIAPAV
jgi:hypothetical protein